jgi:hypothetical protein
VNDLSYLWQSEPEVVAQTLFGSAFCEKMNAPRRTTAESETSEKVKGEKKIVSKSENEQQLRKTKRTETSIKREKQAESFVKSKKLPVVYEK